MDTFCIDRGTLLDNPSVKTLEEPNKHTIHCLVDVSRCYSSGFEVLRDPTSTNSTTDSSTYCRVFKLDATGNDAALALARSTGSTAHGCTTCTGDSASSQRAGFRATITGSYETDDLREPKVLTVSTVQPSDVVCPAGVVAVDVCSTSSGGGTSGYVIAHGSLMMVSWGIILPSGVLIAHFFRHQDPQWFLIHRAMQVGGLLFALGGFIIAVTQFSVFAPNYYAPAQAHGIMGLIVMTLGLMQPINAYFRPHKDKKSATVSSARQKWECLHKGSGWFAITLAVPTIILGTKLAGGSRTVSFLIAYGVLASVVGVVLFLYRRKSYESLVKS